MTSVTTRPACRDLPIVDFQPLYVPSTWEQWFEASYQAPDWLIQVSLQITVRARCLP